MIKTTKHMASVAVYLSTYVTVSVMNLAQLSLPYVRESEQEGLQNTRWRWRMGPKSNLNNISGCGFRSILDLFYPQPQACFCLRACGCKFGSGGGGGIDCAGLHTMCVPQGVVGGRLQSAQRVLLPGISVCPPPPCEIKVITRPDELQSKYWHPVAHTPTWAHGS